MGRKKDQHDNGAHSIRLPGVLIDQIKEKDERGEYEEDTRSFEIQGKNKGKEKLTRKEQRKQDRIAKKKKKQPERPKVSETRNGKLAKVGKSILKSTRKGGDELVGESEKFEGFSDVDLRDEDNESQSDMDDDFGESDFDSEVSDLEEEEEPLAKLRALKEQKSKTTGLEKKNKLEQKKSGAEGVKSDITASRPSHVEDLLRRDEEDMDFYAKKLGLKNGKSKLNKSHEDDEIGGLLEGIDLDFTNDSEENDMSEGFDDLSEEVDFSSGDSDGDSEGGTHRRKENPYVAPSDDVIPNKEEEQTVNSYVPPAMRRRMANNSISLEAEDMQKAIKSSLNKLSEANISNITNHINSLFSSYPRQTMIEALTSIIIDGTVQQIRLLDTFVYLHGALATAIHKLQGVEFGAYFIQTLVENFENYMAKGEGKQAANIISLLCAIYSFHLMSAKLLYDIIRSLISSLNENNADVLLRLVQTSGNQMRSEDPSSLKEIILLVNTSVNKESLSPRLVYLIETISSLKNNKLKSKNEAASNLSVNLRKFISSIHSKSTDTLQISLDDIHNIETRGKWWLVGSAWKGTDSNKDSGFDQAAVNETLDNAEPNWMQVAKSHRINTDVRRAVFISIMSASDYVDSLTKLEKLRLKKSQEREVPKMLIFCTGIETSWNPYYGVLGSKLCDSHTHRKTFQLILWDLLKEMDKSFDDDSDENDFLDFDSANDENKMHKIFNLGRLFGFLMAEGSLQLHLLRVVNFLTASPDVVVFLEVLFVTFYDRVAKIARKQTFKGIASSAFDRTSDSRDRIIFERLIKAKDEKVLLKGIQYFIENNVKKSTLVDNTHTKKRIEWGMSTTIQFIEEFGTD